MSECRPVNPYSDEVIVRMAQSLTAEQWVILDAVKWVIYYFPTMDNRYDDLIDKGILWVGHHNEIMLTALGYYVYAWRDVMYGTE